MGASSCGVAEEVVLDDDTGREDDEALGSDRCCCCCCCSTLVGFVVVARGGQEGDDEDVDSELEDPCDSVGGNKAVAEVLLLWLVLLRGDWDCCSVIMVLAVVWEDRVECKKACP